MNRFIKSILQIKTLYVFLTLFVLTFLINFAYYEYVSTDQVSREYHEKIQAKQEAEVYNEYEDYMADFKDDLAEIELEEPTINSYNWDSFVVDFVYASILCTIICLGLSFLIFVSFQFTNDYSRIPFGNLFKSSLLAYIIFPLDVVFKIIWFGLIQTDYQVEDLQNMYSYLNPSIQTFMESPKEYQWYNYLFSDINLQSIIFVLLIPLFLKGLIEYRYSDLLKKMWIPFIGFFIVFHIVSPYYIYLIFIF